MKSHFLPVTLRIVAAWFGLVLLVAGRLAPPLWGAERPNVLFIAVDDLNDWIGCLGGHPQAHTPNIDRLAARGVNFAHAYCASPVCNPSRSALLSGLRSSTSGVYNNDIDWRQKPAGKVMTLNQCFQAAGYYTVGAGKIYHESFSRREDWNEYKKGGGGKAEPPAGADEGVGGIKFAPIDAPDEDMGDYQTVSYCIEQLNKPRDKPLFLACGLKKPHMPWFVPRKYYDLFPLESVQLPQVLENDLDDVPPAGRRMARPEGDHAKMLASGRWKEAVRGYLAAGAFCDAQIGRLMEAFDKCPCRDNTIVVLWGDHGWHLGEKQHWRKFALWEEATRAPLLFVVPGVTRPGGVCQRTVDFMSIYPTLCELCDVEVPKHVEGVSIKPLLADPRAAWDRPAVTTHGFQNHAVRSEQWRYIRYANGDEELYDETADPHEWKNLASDAKYAEMKSALARWFPAANVPQDRPVTGSDEGGGDEGKTRKAEKRAKQAERKAAAD